MTDTNRELDGDMKMIASMVKILATIEARTMYDDMAARKDKINDLSEAMHEAINAKIDEGAQYELGDFVGATLIGMFSRVIDSCIEEAQHDIKKSPTPGKDPRDEGFSLTGIHFARRVITLTHLLTRMSQDMLVKHKEHIKGSFGDANQ